MKLTRVRLAFTVGALFAVSAVALGVLAYRTAQQRLFSTEFAVSTPQEIARWLAEAKSNPDVQLLEWTSHGEQPIPIERLDSVVAKEDSITVRRYLEPAEFLSSLNALAKNGYSLDPTQFEAEAQRHKLRVVLPTIGSALALVLALFFFWGGRTVGSSRAT